ncbi:MAG TPA: carbohydrate porin, partial [Bryobacteraceae bacterium]|nr:carbohydrate porin [Bryobacteraceae bacterium]
MERTPASLRVRITRALCALAIAALGIETGTVRAQMPAADPADATSRADAGCNGCNDQPKPPGGEEAKSADKSESSDQNKEEKFNVFGQGTVISQWHGTFLSPYSGPHSFLSENELATSETATLFMGLRLWDGGELYFDPEISGGLGLSDVFGVAAFPNGDIQRVGKPAPTPYVSHLYVAQTLGFGGEQEKVESGPNALAGSRDVSRLTVYLGKFAAEDFFDGNAYSHDARSQFMNWALEYNAAWDYPADTRGYTYGGVIELNEANWAFRYGLFAEPLVANGPDLDPHFDAAHGQAWELEERYRLFEHPGKARFLVYWNRADMGNYNEATFDPVFGLNIANTRKYSSKYGYGLSLEQEFSKDLGGFLRWGWDDGHTETWA